MEKIVVPISGTTISFRMKYLDIHQTAKFLGVHFQTVNNWRISGILTREKVDGKWKFDLDQLQTLKDDIESRKVDLEKFKEVCENSDYNLLETAKQMGMTRWSVEVFAKKRGLWKSRQFVDFSEEIVKQLFEEYRNVEEVRRQLSKLGYKKGVSAHNIIKILESLYDNWNAMIERPQNQSCPMTKEKLFNISFQADWTEWKADLLLRELGFQGCWYRWIREFVDLDELMRNVQHIISNETESEILNNNSLEHKIAKVKLFTNQTLECFKILDNNVEIFSTERLGDISKKLNVPYSFVKRYRIIHNIPLSETAYAKSEIEEIIFEHLENLGFSPEKSRIYGDDIRREIDIRIGNLGIEVNGDYFHSDEFRNERYHADKLELINKHGIELIQFHENEIRSKKEIVFSIIENKLGLSEKIHARNYSIVEVQSKDAQIFLKQNDIQGFVQSNVYIGLKYKDELVMVMALDTLNNNEWELIRLVTKINMVVVGGASKLFRYFVRKIDPEVVVCYADRRFGNGKVFEKLGFVNDGVTEPSYFYANGYKKLDRQQCQEHIISETEHLSEKEIMRNKGYFRIFDSGNYIYKWRKQ